MSTEDTDVVVVGAGPAGLSCAARLERAGRRVVVLEAKDAPGGRCRTDVVDGFRIDSGFGVVATGDPRVREVLDLAALHLCPFGRGFAVRRGETLTVVADPLRHPRHAWSSATGPYRDPAVFRALAAWLAPSLPTPRRSPAPETLARSLDAAGVRGPIRTDLLEPLLSALLLRGPDESSAAFARLLARSFAVGTPGLPTQGLSAVAAQLAERVSDVRTSTRVRTVRRTGTTWRVDLAAGGAVRAERVVLATDPVAAAGLVGRDAPPTRGLVTWWFATDTPPTDLPFLVLDPAPRPIVHTAVVSNVAPSYAPAGRHLVQASAVLAPGADPASTEEVRADLAGIYRVPTARWEEVALTVVPHAVPALPPHRRPEPDARIDEGLYVCADDRDTATLHGALDSGRRAARTLLHHDRAARRALRSPRP